MLSDACYLHKATVNSICDHSDARPTRRRRINNAGLYLVQQRVLINMQELQFVTMQKSVASNTCILQIVHTACTAQAADQRALLRGATTGFQCARVSLHWPLSLRLSITMCGEAEAGASTSIAFVP